MGDELEQYLQNRLAVVTFNVSRASQNKSIEVMNIMSKNQSKNGCTTKKNFSNSLFFLKTIA